MKLRTTISFNIDAANFMEAAEYQKQVEKLVSDIKRTYPDAAYEMRERRDKSRQRKTHKYGSE